MKNDDKFDPVPFSEFKKEALKDLELKKMYDDLELEFSIIQQVIRKRIEKGITQNSWLKRWARNNLQFRVLSGEVLILRWLFWTKWPVLWVGNFKFPFSG